MKATKKINKVVSLMETIRNNFLTTGKVNELTSNVFNNMVNTLTEKELIAAEILYIRREQIAIQNN